MKTIAFDLDGTLAYYKEWKGITHIGDPLPGAVNMINKLVNRGYDVVIYTTRTNPNVNIEAAEQLKERIQIWLKDNGFNEAVRVEEYKPIAILYVDDRGMSVKSNCDWTDSKRLDYLNYVIETMEQQ